MRFIFSRGWPHNKIISQYHATSTWLVIYQFLFFISVSVITNAMYLYLHQVLGMTASIAMLTVGSYFSIQYALHFAAGFIVGRHVSFQTGILWASGLQFMGAGLLMGHSMSTFYSGATILVVGVGLSVTNYNIICNQIAQSTQQRQSIFLKNLLSLSLGLFVGELIMGYCQVLHQLPALFVVSLLMNVISLAVIKRLWPTLRQLDESSLHQASLASIKTQCVTVLLVGLVVFFLLSNRFSLALPLLSMIIFFSYQWLIYCRQEKKDPRSLPRCRLFLVLLGFIIILQVVQLLQPMIMMHFLQFNVNRSLCGWHIPSAWLDDERGLICIAMIIYLLSSNDQSGFLYRWLPQQRLVVSSLLLLLAFALLLLGLLSADTHQGVAISWVIGYQTLCAIAMVILYLESHTLVGQWLPVPLQSQAMGLVCCSYGVSSWLATQASLFVVGNTPSLSTNSTYQPLIQLHEIMLLVVLAIFILLAILCVSTARKSSMQRYI